MNPLPRPPVTPENGSKPNEKALNFPVASASAASSDMISESSGEKLSTASKAYNNSETGHPNKTETMPPKYDTSNIDRQISLAELKSIMSDLQSQETKETRWNKYTRLAVSLFALSIIGNFGMIWTA